MTGQEDFFTRDLANEGVKFPLTRPDGSQTEHWLIIRGVDSDSFRLAETMEKRRAISISMIEDKKEQAMAMLESKTQLIASLVSDWSFDQEFTEENVLSFLRQAPQIADAIDTLASRRKLFFVNRSSGSDNTQNAGSPST